MSNQDKQKILVVEVRRNDSVTARVVEMDDTAIEQIEEYYSSCIAPIFTSSPTPEDVVNAEILPISDAFASEYLGRRSVDRALRDAGLPIPPEAQIEAAGVYRR